MNETKDTSGAKSGTAALAVGALGVVFGDIGTSPLYAFRECFLPEHGLAVSEANVFGILSLIFWTLVLIICLKYMWFVLRADNKGEGGILALMALSLRNSEETGWKRVAIVSLGLFGAALLYGDGAITPAITVLSAMEGLKVLTPTFETYVIPITVAILIGIFFFQRIGTARIGSIFGPIIGVWFITLAVLGLTNIWENPNILMAINPSFALDFFIRNGYTAFLALAGVFLVVTGGEALYADMGHFGRKPIRWSWFGLVLPSLVLNYFGQGALLLKSPEKITNPFYLMAPEWALGFLLVIATLASIIASQALISGVFSITRQAVQLGYVPRLPIIHTSSAEIGQIYVPFVNWTLLVLVVWLVFAFKSSTALASAYGIAVTATMVITALLFGYVAKTKWRWSWWKLAPIVGVFLIIDFAFLSTNLLKIVHGGWVPLALGVFIFLLMTTWKEGRRILAETLRGRSISAEDFIQKVELEAPHRIRGNAIYMSSETWGVPIPLLHNLKHFKVLHEKVAILTIRTREVPSVPKDKRVEIESIGKNIFRIVAYYGFMETPKIKHILEACRENRLDFHIHDTTFVLGRETILPSKGGGMALWREVLFAVMTRNAQRPTAFFKIPPNQVIEVGIQVEI